MFEGTQKRKHDLILKCSLDSFIAFSVKNGKWIPLHQLGKWLAPGFVLCVWTGILCSSSVWVEINCCQGWTWTSDLRASISQVLIPQMWTTVHLVFVVLGIKAKASCLLSEHYANWATFSAQGGWGFLELQNMVKSYYWQVSEKKATELRF